MIIDCFTFLNELDLLEGRLEYLYDTVDYFVIVESNTTFTGKHKELNFLANRARYNKYADKIFYYPFAPEEDVPEFNEKIEKCDFGTSPWQVEFKQRNYIKNALKFFDPDAIVLMGDLDEIPSKESINLAKENLGTAADAFALSQDMFFYNFRQKQSYPCKATVITTNKFLQENGAQWLRDMRWHIPFIFNGGWHLTYWGSPDMISNKIKSFAHQELNQEKFTDQNLISQRIKSGVDPFEGQPLITVNPDSISTEIYTIFNKYGSC